MKEKHKVGKGIIEKDHRNNKEIETRGVEREATLRQEKNKTTSHKIQFFQGNEVAQEIIDLAHPKEEKDQEEEIIRKEESGHNREIRQTGEVKKEEEDGHNHGINKEGHQIDGRDHNLQNLGEITQMIDQILQDLKEVTIQIEGALHQGNTTITVETEPQSQEGGNKDHKETMTGKEIEENMRKETMTGKETEENMMDIDRGKETKLQRTDTKKITDHIDHMIIDTNKDQGAQLHINISKAIMIVKNVERIMETENAAINIRQIESALFAGRANISQTFVNIIQQLQKTINRLQQTECLQSAKPTTKK